MTFPSTPRNARIDLFVNGAWTDITADVYDRDDIVITYGKPNETSQTDPATCSMTLKWRDGKYNPRNPLGAYYGSLGRNTPIRVRIDLTPSDSYRFWGEVPSWPPQRDETGKDVWVPIQAGGLLRRLGQGQQPLESAARRYYRTTYPVAYWPLSDPSGSAWGAMLTGTAYRYPWVPSNSLVEYALGEGDLGPQGQSLSLTNTGTNLGAWSGGHCVGAVDGMGIAAEFTFQAENLSGELWFVVQDYGSSGTFKKDEWSVQIRADGTNNDIQGWSYLNLDAGPAVNINVADTGPRTEVTDGKLHHIRLHMDQNGADIDVAVYLDGVSILTWTEVGVVIGHAFHARFRYAAGASASPASIGNVIVWEGPDIPLIAESSAAALAYDGEAAGRRFDRLCFQTDTLHQTTGDLDDTLPMGPQYPDTLNAQFEEIEATDAGMLWEPNASVAVAYRTRASLYNQSATATISVTAKQLSPPFDPVDDDQNLRNFITAQRREGLAHEVVQTTGPLSVSEPPTGAGRYDDAITVNVETDEMLPARAGWSLLLGTVNEARYPQVTVDLGKDEVAADVALSAALLTIEVGDRIVITDAEAFGIYDDISLIVLGYTETLNVFKHTITFNCVPASPYKVAELDHNDTRLGPSPTYGTYLTAGVNTTATSWTVLSGEGSGAFRESEIWSTTGPFPIPLMIGGEEVTLTAVSGTTPGATQTFTVTRSVNGVVKSHLSGAAVELKTPAILAL